MAAKVHWAANTGTGIPNPPGAYNRVNQGFTPIFNGKPCMTLEEYDGKRLRKTSMRKTVDYNCSVIKYLEDRVWQRGAIDRPALQPDILYYPEMHPPMGYLDNPVNAVCTRFVRTATNKMRCPVFCLAWTPEGRRLITGASSGEFTLWNSLTFNFETILQAHDSSVRSMVWSHNDQWMLTGDHSGYIKYWQINMNNVKMFQAHKEPVRGISFAPNDQKMVTCSDDGTVRLWDFFRCHEEKLLRGHGSDVKCCDWHPYMALVVSGSKDNQQPIRLWDPKSGSSLATLHAHKSTVTALRFNSNGNWLLTASRDHLLKLFDLRRLDRELQVFRGHKKEAFCVAWHPVHETLVASGGSDGAIMFWNVGTDKEVGCIEQAHDSLIWELAWHPLGHVLASGSNDHSSRFWTRSRPGDTMLDKYNLNIADTSVDGSTSAAAAVAIAVAATGSGAVAATGSAAAAGNRGGDDSGVRGGLDSTADFLADGSRSGADDGSLSEQTIIPGMGPGDRVDPPPVVDGAVEGDAEEPARNNNNAGFEPRHHTRRPHWRFAHQWNQNWNHEWDEGRENSEQAPVPEDRQVSMAPDSERGRNAAKRPRNLPADDDGGEEWHHPGHYPDHYDGDGGGFEDGDFETGVYEGEDHDAEQWDMPDDGSHRVHHQQHRHRPPQRLHDQYEDVGEWHHPEDEDFEPQQRHHHHRSDFHRHQQRSVRFRGGPRGARGAAHNRDHRMGNGGMMTPQHHHPGGPPSHPPFSDTDSNGRRPPGNCLADEEHGYMRHEIEDGGGGRRGGAAFRERPTGIGQRGFGRNRGISEYDDESGGGRGRWRGGPIRRGGPGPRPHGGPDEEWMSGPRGSWRPPRGQSGRGLRRGGYF